MNNDIYLGEQDSVAVETLHATSLLPPGPTFEICGSEVNPAQQGYTLVHNYALYFWRPYLGNTAFSLWELLLSFCYGDCDTAYPSISRLARMLTNSDHSRAVVTGRHSHAARATPRGSSLRSSTAGTASRGALGVLQRERLVQIVRHGHGPTLSYTFRVLKSLPLLQPEQVARLSPSLQRDHTAWLERYGIEAQVYHQAFLSDRLGDETHYTPAAPSLTPADGDYMRHAPLSTGHAIRNTNNPQEQNLMKNWWQEALMELRLQLPRSTFETCLLGTQVYSFQDGTLTLKAPGAFAREMLEHRLAPLIRRVLVGICEARVQQVCFVSGVSPQNPGCGEQAQEGKSCAR